MNGKRQLALAVLLCAIVGAPWSSVYAVPIDTKLNGPLSVAVDSQNRVYVANWGMPAGTQSVTVYGPSSPVPVSGSQLYQPSSVAVARNGYLYVSGSDPDLAIFRAGADGILVAVGKLESRYQTAPSGTGYLGTPDTMLMGPGALSLDRDDNIFVLSYQTSDYISINKYAAGSIGRVAPLSIIGGPKSDLHRTTAIAVDPHGNIYAANVSPDSITEYAPGSNGDVTPIATISGA
jgi:hypothetical protein